MTDTNCLIKKPRCGLQAGNPVCAKCGLDTRVGGYTSQQAGEEARSKALAAWQTADDKEQAELSALEQRKAQDTAEYKAEAAQRTEQEAPNTQAAVQQPSNVQQSKGSSWLPKIASFVAVVVVLTGIRVYRQSEERHSQEIMQRTEAAMAAMTREEILAALAPNKTQTPEPAQASQGEVQAELERTRALAAKAEASKQAAEKLQAEKTKEMDQGKLQVDQLRDQGNVNTSAVAIDTFSYWVQLAAFDSVNEAENEKAKLAIRGIVTKISERNVSGKRVFRLRVGPFDSQEEARKARNEFENAGLTSAIIRVQN